MKPLSLLVLLLMACSGNPSAPKLCYNESTVIDANGGLHCVQNPTPVPCPPTSVC